MAESANSMAVCANVHESAYWESMSCKLIPCIYLLCKLRDSAMSQTPEGFEPLFRTSPYLELLGPIFNKKTNAGLVIGLRAQEKHCNARGLVHGGVFSSLADVALGYNAAFQGQEPTPIVTASLSIDYAGAARLGDWIEIYTDTQKVGKSMAFANCYFSVGTKRIVRASGVFSVVNT